MFPACSGFNSKLVSEHYDAVQNTFTSKGFVTYRIDPLAARDASSCNGVSSESVGGDVKIAVDRIKSLDSVKADSINLIGWSWGAKVTLQSIVSSDSPEVQTIIAYYPNCDWLSTWTTNADVLLLFGDKDTIAEPTDCEPVFQASSHGEGSRFAVFPGGLHLFDVEKLTTPVVFKSHHMGFDAKAAKSAWGIVENLKAMRFPTGK